MRYLSTHNQTPIVRNVSCRFDRYNGEKTVIINDVDADKTVEVGNLMTWCDGVPTLLAYKGGFSSARFETVWFTANTSLDAFIESRPWLDAQKDAFYARFEAVFYLETHGAQLKEIFRRPTVIDPPVTDQAIGLDIPSE